MMTYRQFEEKYFSGDNWTCDLNRIEDAWRKYFHENVDVGDGVTVCYWTDRKSYTVIKRTKCTLTLRRDKATLKPEFKPEFIIGGFAAHCTNQDQQEYDYEFDPSGQTVVAHWSERKKGFYVDKCLRVIGGRHEFYDYNF